MTLMRNRSNKKENGSNVLQKKKDTTIPTVTSSKALTTLMPITPFVNVGISRNSFATFF